MGIDFNKLKTDIVSPSYYSVNKVRKAMGSAE